MHYVQIETVIFMSFSYSRW